MTFRAVMRMLWAWRFVTLPALILSFVCGLWVYGNTAPRYSLSASNLLLAPSHAEAGELANPYLRLGNGVSLAADVVSISLTDNNTVESYTRERPDLEYTVTRPGQVNVPLLVFTVSDTDSAAAAQTLDGLVRDAGERLESLQRDAGAPENTWVGFTELTRDTVAQEDHGVPLRNGLVAGAGAVLLSVLLVAVLEGRRHRPPRRNHSSRVRRPGGTLRRTSRAEAARDAADPQPVPQVSAADQAPQGVAGRAGGGNAR